MSGWGEVPIAFGGCALVASGSGALFWPQMGLLCVADLHLGRSRRIARLGGALIPPYETRATLERLRAEVETRQPATVIALGDSFDDDLGAGELDDEERASLLRLIAGRQWLWIAGNHDPAPHDLPGPVLRQATFGPLTFRHEAAPGFEGYEVSGHFHPALRIGPVRRPAFVIGRQRLILPAFGTYTGGLDASRDPVAALAGDGARAVLTGIRPICAPLSAPARGRQRRP